jgi:uncharacterized protein
MPFLILFVVAIIGLALIPQYWVRKVIREHSHERPDFPGTGGELARHLLDEHKLDGVKVEGTDGGDHYDPLDKAVRLLPQHLDGKSLAAVVIAAHEVGHALQDATGYKPLTLRTRLAQQGQYIEILGSVLMLASPVIMALSRNPYVFLFEIAAALLILSFTVIIHAVTLPVEYDASFSRALPILEKGGYLKPEDMPAARKLLKAAALTYVAAAAMSLIDIARWIRILRF